MLRARITVLKPNDSTPCSNTNQNNKRKRVLDSKCYGPESVCPDNQTGKGRDQKSEKDPMMRLHSSYDTEWSAHSRKKEKSMG